MQSDSKAKTCQQSAAAEKKKQKEIKVTARPTQPISH